MFHQFIIMENRETEDVLLKRLKLMPLARFLVPSSTGYYQSRTWSRIFGETELKIIF